MRSVEVEVAGCLSSHVGATATATAADRHELCKHEQNAAMPARCMLLQSDISLSLWQQTNCLLLSLGGTGHRSCVRKAASGAPD